LHYRIIIYYIDIKYIGVSTKDICLVAVVFQREKRRRYLTELQHNTQTLNNKTTYKAP